MSTELDTAFTYTDLEDAPATHRHAARAVVFAVPESLIAARIGVDESHLKKILEHPPVAVAIEAMQIQAIKQSADQAEIWHGLIGRGIQVIHDVMHGTDMKLALKATFEYLDRQPNPDFMKRRREDMPGGDDVLESDEIRKLKELARELKQVGATHERTDTGTIPDGREPAINVSHSLTRDEPGAYNPDSSAVNDGRNDESTGSIGDARDGLSANDLDEYDD